MKRGPGLAVGGLVVALACAIGWVASHAGAPSAPGIDVGAESVADDSTSSSPPPPLASPGVNRPARAATKVPAVSRPERPSAPVGGPARGQVLDPDGHPVAGALVREIGAPEPAPTVTTDADGRFSLDRIATPPGALLVRAPGFADAIVAARAIQAGLSVPLERGWTISGTVRDADTDEPVAATSVRASPASSPREVDPLRTKTDADGAFRLVVPDVGTYVLDVGNRYLGEQPEPGDDWVPTEVEGVAAGTSGVRVALARGRAIEGEIVDEQGARLARAVWVDAVKRTAAGDADYTMRKLVLSVGGRLRVPGLSPGRYDLHLKPKPSPDDAGETPFAETVVPDIAAGTSGLVAHLYRGFVLVGRLTDGTGAAIVGGGRLYAYRAGEPARSHPVFGEVPGDGTFRVGPLDGSYRYDLLATEFPGYVPAMLEGVAPRDGNVAIVLKAGQAIVGRVETEDGKPAPAGVPIGVVGQGLDPRSESARSFTYTRADGTFVTDGLADAGYSLEAGGGTSGFLGTVVLGVRPGAKDLVLRVSAGTTLEGMLVDEKGEPVAAASLGADDGARVAAMRPYAQVGDDGKFVLRGLRAGPVRLWAMLGARSVNLGTVGAPGKDVRVVVASR